MLAGITFVTATYMMEDMEDKIVSLLLVLYHPYVGHTLASTGQGDPGWCPRELIDRGFAPTVSARGRAGGPRALPSAASIRAGAWHG